MKDTRWLKVGLASMLLVIMVLSGTALAEVSLGGKIETMAGVVLGPDDSLDTTWLEHLKLDFLLPQMGDTSAKFEIDLYYEPQSDQGTPNFQGDVTKLYLRHRFENLSLTVGRQPISWSFGSLLNPVDYGQSMGLLSEQFASKQSENAILGYIPLGVTSNVTVIASFPEFGSEPKVGVRARTDLMGYDLTMNYVRSPKLMAGVVPAYQQLGLTVKGDLGPVGVYGAVGTHFQDKGVSLGDLVYLVGSDYSFYLDNGSKLMTQLEYLHDEGRQSRMLFAEEPDLVTGLLSYEIDEFASVSLAVSVNPADQSCFIAPVYKNLIGSGLDLAVTGGVLVGESGAEFGPGGMLALPKGMVRASLSYPF